MRLSYSLLWHYRNQRSSDRLIPTRLLHTFLTNHFFFKNESKIYRFAAVVYEHGSGSTG